MIQAKYRRRYAIALLVACLFLLPWLFYAQIPDILNPPSGDGLAPAPVHVPSFDPVPVTAPIELQYEGYPLQDVLDWLHQRVPDTLITMPMLQTIDQVCRQKNISLGLMLGIINAEHSLLSASALMAEGGWVQYRDAQLNPFSYGWTDVNTVPAIGVARSAIGAAGIITGEVTSWQSYGWGSQKFTDFLKSLSLYYRLGKNGIPTQAFSWEQAVSDVENGLSQYVETNDLSGWAAQVRTDIGQGITVFGQTNMGILGKVIPASGGATVLDKFMAATATGWKYAKNALYNGGLEAEAAVSGQLNHVYGVVTAENVALTVLFVGAAILAIGLTDGLAAPAILALAG
ncbi:hypothetical protein CEB3_c18530 [Peptococcaceae bacterium CEB3]|nr:hypothetical protein CEB3_c18530 [Peptococcaceae bacterium CEB3]